MKKSLLVALFASIAIAGCYYDNEEELYPQQTTTSTTINDSVPVTYSGDISPLIANNCAISGCHVAGAQAPDLSDYNKLKANIAAVKTEAIDNKTMPFGGPPLSNANIAKLQKWIDAGAPNN